MVCVFHINAHALFRIYLTHTHTHPAYVTVCFNEIRFIRAYVSIISDSVHVKWPALC